MTFARRIFTLAGIYGLLVMTPMYFLEPQISAMGKPLSNPESYYGFVGVTLVFQLVFLTVGRDPERFRPIMLLGVLEKASFAVEPPDIERQAGGGHERDHREHHKDQDLAALYARSTPLQLMTIVTSLPMPSRPLVSRGRSWAMSGMIRSWW